MFCLYISITIFPINSVFILNLKTGFWSPPPPTAQRIMFFFLTHY